MKKYWHIWVGVAILLLAVLIVLGVAFLPRMAAKSDMKELLVLAAAPDTQYVVLVDPAYVHPGILAGQGRDLRLEGALLEQTRSALLSISDGFSYVQKESIGSGSFAPYLLVRGAQDEITRIYLTENEFYAELKGSIYYFSPKDMQAYTALYNELMAAFS